MFLPSQIIVLALSLILCIISVVLLRTKVRTYKTKTKELEQATAISREESEDFISMAIFQIRAPLTAISGYSSLILEGDYGPVESGVKDAANTIYLSAHNLVGVVDDYVNMLRLELDQLKYNFSEINIKVLIEEVIKEFAPNLENKKTTLNFTSEITERKDIMITADVSKIRQIIRNLIDNAIKYTDEGKIIIILSLTEKNKILISIKDTGVGIAPETKPKLFKRFSRADDAHNTTTLGTGLGLYIARQMVEAHKGRIWVESQGKGKGSEFYVELPGDTK